MTFRDKTQYVVYVVAVVLVMDFIWFGYLPSKKRLEALQQSRYQQTSTVSKAREITRQIPIVKQQIETLQTRLDQWQQRLPRERSMAQFLKDMSQMMKRHGLTEQVITPGTEIAMEELVCIPVSMHCRGTLYQLFAFFKDLDALQRLVRFEKITFERNSESSGGDVNMYTDIVIFYGAPVT